LSKSKPTLEQRVALLENHMLSKIDLAELEHRILETMYHLADLLEITRSELDFRKGGGKQ
jgi:hypothetical protein